MKRSLLKETFVFAVSLMHTALFVYAALTKLADFENFQVQLGQSPLVGGFAGALSIGVPTVELLLAGGLLWPRLRFAALTGSYFLMSLFSAYIFVMLRYSPYVPCSCGGILDDMGWEDHLLFNLFFVSSGGIATWLAGDTRYSMRSRLAILLLLPLLALVNVFALYAASEQKTTVRNAFTRRFDKHPTRLLHELKLPYDSYYLAGYGDGKIYLGNRVAPLTLTLVDTTLAQMASFEVSIPKTTTGFRSPRMTVRPPYFYFHDGTKPVVYRGLLTERKGMRMALACEFFTLFEPLGEAGAAVRSSSKGTQENVLGLLPFDGSELRLYDGLLTKQADGVFDTDGMLLYNKELDRAVHLYYYRNEFLVMDGNMKLQTKGHTIDTISKAQIKTVEVKSKQMRTLAEQPLLVNAEAATSGRYLFVQSKLMGRFEPADMWDMAAVIDVYDLLNGGYVFSFYSYDKEGAKLDGFLVGDDLVVTLNGKWLGVSRIGGNYYRKF